MTADRITELTRKADAAQAAAADLDKDIANALADGVDEEIIADMRQRRRQLVEQSDDIGEAIAVLEARANDPNEKTKAANAAKARKDARSQAEGYVRSAAAVDRALVALESAFVEMRTRETEMRRALAKVGADDVRISNQVVPSTRWAMWSNAPVLCDAMALPFTPHNKRRRLAESTQRIIPQIPE